MSELPGPISFGLESVRDGSYWGHEWNLASRMHALETV